MAFTDAFTDTNGTNLESHGSSWTRVDGSAGMGTIQSNTAYCNTSNSTGAYFRCPDQGTPVSKQYVQFRQTSADHYSWCVLRAADKDNFIGIRNYGGVIELYKRTSGSYTNLANISNSYSSSKVIKLEITSSTYEVFVNGVSVGSGSYNTSGLPAWPGRAGMVMRGQVGDSFDDFEHGNDAGTIHDGAMSNATTTSETIAGLRVADAAMTDAATTAETIGGDRVALGALSDGATASQTIAGDIVTGGGPWTPDEISSAIVLWMDTSDAASITHSAGATSQIASQIGSITADQSSAGAKPTYSATARNSLPGLTFDGGDFLDLSALTGFPTGNAAGARMVVGYQSAGSGNWRSALSYGAAVNAQHRSISINDSSLVAIDYWDIGVTLPSAPTWSNTDAIVYAHEDGSSTADLISNGDTTTDVDDASTGTRSTASTRGRVGANSDTTAGDLWVGVLQEWFVFNRVLTDDERERMEGYLAHKWGLTGKLPSGHPYKSSAPTIPGGGGTTHDGEMTSAAATTESIAGLRVADAAMTDAAATSQTIGGDRVALGAMTDATTTTQTIAGDRVALGAMTDATTASESIAGTRVHNAEMTDAATTSQTLDTAFSVWGEVLDGATTAEVIEGTRVALGALEDAAATDQTIDGIRFAMGEMTNGATTGQTIEGTIPIDDLEADDLEIGPVVFTAPALTQNMFLDVGPYEFSVPTLTTTYDVSDEVPLPPEDLPGAAGTYHYIPFPEQQSEVKRRQPYSGRYLFIPDD